MQDFEDVISFIYKFYLLKDEQLEIQATLDEGSLIDINIVKKTSRTLRRTGIITVTKEHPSTAEAFPDQALLSWTVGKRALLDDTQQTFDWLHKGWILKEVRLKQDGRSVERIYYRMGYRLYVYLLNKQLKDSKNFAHQLTQYQSDTAQHMEQITCMRNERLLQLKDLALYLSASLQWSLNDLEVQTVFPMNWSTSKRINGLNFLLAFLIISSKKEIFDWKEIGAQYYPGIGGSKAFDAYKIEYLNMLEKISGQSVEALGMISSGQITSIYFAGDLQGTWSNFSAGPVHALTNISVFHDHYSTKATTLWLVENRAILTRMSAEPHFLQDTNSLIIGVDGHLRSAHKHFIRQLLENSGINQAIFWSDYDEAGLQIAREMFQSTTGYVVRHKWICPDHSVITNWEEYQQSMESLLLNMKSEQEFVLGEAADWRSWINR